MLVFQLIPPQCSMQQFQGNIPKSLDAAGGYRWGGRQWQATAGREKTCNSHHSSMAMSSGTTVARPIAHRIRLVMIGSVPWPDIDGGIDLGTDGIFILGKI